VQAIDVDSKLKREKMSKVGVKIKRLKAGWDNDYLHKVIDMKI